MQKPLISIVIPVYNEEKYIKECLDSIIAQTYENVEVIIVNDGSIDKTKEVCEEYEKKDGRISLISIDHAGVSAARNTGLDRIKGEYFFFMDSDDIIDSDCLDLLYEAMITNNVDMVTCNFKNAKNQMISNYYKKDVLLDKTTALYDALNCQHKTLPAWGILYKSSMFSDLRFEDYRLGEDGLYFIKALSRANNIYFISKNLYNYRDDNAGSALHLGDEKFFFDGFKSYLKIFEHVSGIDARFGNCAKSLLLRQSIFCYFKIRRLDKVSEENKEIENVIKDYRRAVIKNPKASLLIRSLCLFSYLGLGFLNTIYNGYLYLR